MRPILLLAAVVALAAGSALAATTPQQDVMKGCSAKWSAMSAADKGKTKRTAFMSTCMKAPGATAAPAMAMKPAATGTMAMKPADIGGSAKCKDGATVTYKHRQGTCSGRGGVTTWM
jgi:hypothetical protein